MATKQIKIGSKFVFNGNYYCSYTVKQAKQMTVTNVITYKKGTKVSLGVFDICEKRLKRGIETLLVDYKGRSKSTTLIPQTLIKIITKKAKTYSGLGNQIFKDNLKALAKEYPNHTLKQLIKLATG